MKEIGVSFFLFAVATFFLICVHRVMLSYRRRTLAVFLMYPIGVFVLGWVMSVSATALMVYVLLSLLSFIWLITPVLGDSAPTSRIIAFLRTNHRTSYRNIVRLFSNKDLVDKRLGDLAASGFIRKKYSRYTATAAGRFVARIVSAYVSFIGWEASV